METTVELFVSARLAEALYRVSRESIQRAATRGVVRFRIRGERAEYLAQDVEKFAAARQAPPAERKFS